MKNSIPSDSKQKYVFSGIAVVLGILSAIAPIWPAGDVAPRVGGLLVIAGILELLHSFRRSSDEERKSAWFGHNNFDLLLFCLSMQRTLSELL
ncbi:MAG: hypothetical protein IPG99_01075 [Ignavibacteria bacterium]|nr:hypothetical protein [Ignavibacteria bacterium]